MEGKDLYPGYPAPLADLHLHTYNNHENTVKMMDSLERLGVTDANMLAITYVDTPFQNNLTTMFDRETIKNVRLHAFAGHYYHPDYNYNNVSFLKQTEMLLDMGFDGIKFIDMKPNFRKYVGFGWDSPLYNDTFAFLEERQVPIIAHINDPERFWGPPELLPPGALKWGWWYGNGEYLSFEEIYNEVLTRLKRNPDLNLVLAHFGYVAGRYDRAVELMETYKNLKFDLTPGDLFQCFGERTEDWHNFFIRYRDRIYYGTDSMSSDYESHFDKCKSKRDAVVGGLCDEPTEKPSPQFPDRMTTGLYLDKETLDCICCKNYFRLLGKEHKPLRLDLFEEHTDTVCRVLSNSPDSESTVKLLKENFKILSK